MKQSKLFKGTTLEIPYLKFRKNILGRISLFILLIFYLGLFIDGFIAPYHFNTKFRNKSYHPPHSLLFLHENKFIGPFIYEYKQINPFFKKYRVDKTTIHKIHFFVKGDTYKLFFFIPANIHLFGTHDGAPVYLFGADNLGRDLFSRIVYGARVSLTIGFVTVFFALFVGLIIGGFSGYIGGFTDWILMRICEVFILLPTFYFFLFLRSLLPADMDPAQKFLMISLILAVPGSIASSRGIRNWVLSLKHKDFVIASQIGGASPLRIIFKHILPQIRNLIILGITLSIPGVILGETGLSFLNLGITEPSVSWGMLMSAALDINILLQFPWIIIPSFFIIMVVFCFFAFGYAVKDSLDPKTAA